MSCPSKTMVPLLAGSVPASTARNVDFPAPFGPMRPVILPAGTSIDTPSTAWRPSKWRWMSLAISSGRSAAGASAGASMVHVLEHWSAFEHMPWFGTHAVRPEPQEANDQEADRHPLQGRDQARRPNGGRDEACDLLEADRDEQRAEDGTDVVAAPADDDGREQDDGLRVEPYGRRPELDEADQDSA